MLTEKEIKKLNNDIEKTDLTLLQKSVIKDDKLGCHFFAKNTAEKWLNSIKQNKQKKKC